MDMTVMDMSVVVQFLGRDHYVELDCEEDSDYYPIGLYLVSGMVDLTYLLQEQVICEMVMRCVTSDDIYNMERELREQQAIDLAEDAKYDSINY